METTMTDTKDLTARVTALEKDIATEIAVLRTELRWIKFLLFALVALNLPNIASYIPTAP